MKFPFVPDYYFPDIYAIDPERLRARGVKVLLADLDNTLAPYGVPKPSGEVVAWRARLEQAGITLFLLSNSRRPGRAQHYAEALGIPYEGHAGKPKSGGFRRALARMNAAPEEAAIVGDQIFTDILGGEPSGGPDPAGPPHPVWDGLSGLALWHRDAVPGRGRGRAPSVMRRDARQPSAMRPGAGENAEKLPQNPPDYGNSLAKARKVL